MTETAANLDLTQLALRESEQVEWKEGVADIKDVVKTLCAFANDLANLGGGYVVCGAAERKDEHGFPTLDRVGLTADRLKEVEGKVLQQCRDLVSPGIMPRVEILAAGGPDRRILVFVQPATGHAHTYRDGEATHHWVRNSRETVRAQNGILRELLVRKGDREPWDRRMCATATVGDLDLLALRDALQRMKVYAGEIGVEPYLSDDRTLNAMVPPLCAREPLTGILRPRNFAILLFGRSPQRFIPGAISLFSRYPGRDRSDATALRHDLVGTAIDQARRLAALLDEEAYTAFDKTDRQTPNKAKYPKRALYEAMGNALAHRDYESYDPTRITAFADRLEFVSPGALPFGVSINALRDGKAVARWRNQTLAWFFMRLQIGQAEGQGIPTIIRTMNEEGCPPPQFEADAVRVICTLECKPDWVLQKLAHDKQETLNMFLKFTREYSNSNLKETISNLNDKKNPQDISPPPTKESE